MAGFFVTSGQDGQFVNTGSDDSVPGRHAFRQWLEKRYGSIEALNQTLKTSYESYDAIAIPDYDAPPAGSESPAYRTGLRPLYGEFKEQAAWALRDHFAGVLKKEIGRPVLALSYGTPIAYPFYETQNIDGAGTMTYYPFRNPGHAIGFNPGNGAGFHGKIIFQEIDLRSFVGSQYAEVYQRWIGAGDTPERWDAINRHLVGISMAQGFGYWYYDMGNYYDSPEIMAMIAQTSGIARQVMVQEGAGDAKKDVKADATPAADRARFRPDVAVIAGSVGDSHMVNRYMSNVYSNVSTLYQTILCSAGWMLDASGTPYDVHFLADILSRPELQDYKVYIFLQSPFISSEERAQIQQLLANKGRTIVWSHDTGYLSEEGASSEAQSRLIGMNIATKEEMTRRTVQVGAGAGAEAYALTEGVLPYQGMAELLNSIFAIRGQNELVSGYQPFWVEDASSVKLASYNETGEVAFAFKDLPGWRSIYLAAPNSLGGDLLHNIAKAAGAYTCGPAGQAISMNGRFVSIHGLSTTRYPFQMPPGRTILRDALTGKVVAQGEKIVPIDIEAQKTYWFLLE